MVAGGNRLFSKPRFSNSRFRLVAIAISQDANTRHLQPSTLAFFYSSSPTPQCHIDGASNVSLRLIENKSAPAWRSQS
jgi:hypothetical protein